MHHAAHGEKEILVSGGKHSGQELGRLKLAYSKVFSEPMYLIWKNL